MADFFSGFYVASFLLILRYSECLKSGRSKPGFTQKPDAREFNNWTLFIVQKSDTSLDCFVVKDFFSGKV